jgi:hypothetical protein
MTMSVHPPPVVPDVILILGTDAAGKDHVANILSHMIREGGGHVQKRRGFFSATPSRTKDSTKKSLIDYAQERLFLATHGLIAPLMPALVGGVLLGDRLFFSRPDHKLIIIGHHALRALAFHLGRSKKSASSFCLPDYLKNTIGQTREAVNPHVIVLDVDEKIRRRRISDRVATGTEDYLDKYMVLHRERADRIEHCLVRVATELMGAHLLTNNDLPEKAIRAFLENSFRQASKGPQAAFNHN